MAGDDAVPFFGAHELRRRLGHYRWVECRLFEVLGGWVASTPEPRVKAVLAEHSHRHAWHAEIWEARTPRLWDAPGEPPGPASAALGGVLDAMAGAPDTLERLAGAYRVVLPHLLDVYRRHLEVAAPAAEAPVRRWLRIVLDDTLDEWTEGNGLLVALAGAPGAAGRAAAHQARLEALVVEAGGLGPPAGPATGE